MVCKEKGLCFTLVPLLLPAVGHQHWYKAGRHSHSHIGAHPGHLPVKGMIAGQAHAIPGCSLLMSVRAGTAGAAAAATAVGSTGHHMFQAEYTWTCSWQNAASSDRFALKKERQRAHDRCACKMSPFAGVDLQLATKQCM